MNFKTLYRSCFIPWGITLNARLHHNLRPKLLLGTILLPLGGVCRILYRHKKCPKMGISPSSRVFKSTSTINGSNHHPSSTVVGSYLRGQPVLFSHFTCHFSIFVPSSVFHPCVSNSHILKNPKQIRTWYCVLGFNVNDLGELDRISPTYKYLQKKEWFWENAPTESRLILSVHIKRGNNTWRLTSRQNWPRIVYCIPYYLQASQSLV